MYTKCSLTKYLGRPTFQVTIPSSLPSSASINLPPVHIHGDYRQHSVVSTIPDSGGLMEGHHLRAGHYLQATADVGVFEHSLTTDLLNHLVFVQKVFMKVVLLLHLSMVILFCNFTLF